MSKEIFRHHQSRCVSKSSWLHIDIFQFFFANLRYILQTPQKWWVSFLKSLTSTSSSVTSPHATIDFFCKLSIMDVRLCDTFCKCFWVAKDMSLKFLSVDKLHWVPLYSSKSGESIFPAECTTPIIINTLSSESISISPPHQDMYFTYQTIMVVSASLEVIVIKKLHFVNKKWESSVQ